MARMEGEKYSFKKASLDSLGRGRSGCKRCWTPQIPEPSAGGEEGQGGNCLPTVRM